MDRRISPRGGGSMSAEQPKQRIGIVTVSIGLLEQWLQLPASVRILDVRSKDGGVNGQFEILVEGGEAVPETDAREVTPHLTLTVTVTPPRVEFARRDP